MRSPCSPRAPSVSSRLATLFGCAVLSACTTAPTRTPDAPEVAINATVAAAVKEISADRIERTIRTLVAFETRNTLSETASTTRGIGAARRWIQSELTACAKATGGHLVVGTDEHLSPAGPRLPRETNVVNVVATLPGTDPLSRERMFVVSGHYDSRASDVLDANTHAPGANDDASGVAAAMEMACVMSRYPFKATLVFLAVAGEEQGLLGSEHWAAVAQSRGLRIDAMITNDIIGSPVGDAGQTDARQVRLFADGMPPLLRAPAAAKGAAAPADANAAVFEAARLNVETQVRAGGVADLPPNQLGRHLKAAGERYVSGFTVNLIARPDRYLRGGDHMPFLARGIAAVRFIEPFENFAHQHQDVRTENGLRYGDLPEFVDFGYVADVTRINLAGLGTLAMAPSAPQNVQIEVLDLTNDTALRWEANRESDLAGYRVVWRETGSPIWQHHRDVGNVTRVRLEGVSKDNVIFGVQAIDREGNASLASFPLPLRK